MANPQPSNDSSARNEIFEGWRVELETFEGPLDLLLHLIRKKNLDIYDIPIAEITEEYLKYIDLIHHLDIDRAGEFLEMASYLMRMKSKMLLPVEETAEDGEETAEEMKMRLIERLTEYRKFKESTDFFQAREQQFDGVVGLKQYPVNEFGHEVEATLFDLVDAFQKLVERATTEVKDIIAEEISVAEKIRDILSAVEKVKRVKIQDLAGEKPSLMELIALLLGVLELVKSSQVRAIQKFRFGDIYIEKR